MGTPVQADLSEGHGDWIVADTDDRKGFGDRLVPQQ